MGNPANWERLLIVIGDRPQRQPRKKFETRLRFCYDPNSNSLNDLPQPAAGFRTVPRDCYAPSMLHKRISGILAVLICAGLTSCSGEPPPFIGPSYNADSIAKAAIAEYDKNKNGTIDKNEMSASLKAAVESSNTRELREFRWENGDGALTEEEIRKRIEQYVETKSGLFTLTCVVRLNGVPLDGATVTMEPEVFMGDVIKPAKGVTEKGSASLTSEGLDGEGVLAGFYKIKVTKNNAIPARYNTNTTLGFEVSNDSPGEVWLDLRSP